MTTTNSKPWSRSTNYTGLAGIHSELSTGAAARNSQVSRRASDTMAVEQSLVRKHVKSLGFDKRSLEKSMLLYSQRMRDIATQTSRLGTPSDGEGSTVSSAEQPPYSRRPWGASSISRVPTRKGTVSPITCINDEGPIRKADLVHVKKEQARDSISSSQDCCGRSSIDSGYMTSECSDSLSQFYGSDTESHGRWSPSSSVAESINEGKDYAGQQNVVSLSSRTARRRRTRKRRLAAGDRPQLPTVADTEQNKENDVATAVDETVFEIAPFPACSDSSVPLLKLDQLTISDKEDNTSKVLNPLSSGGYWSYRAANSQKPSPVVSKKPKAIQSPSVTSTRLRTNMRRPKPRPSKPFHQIFRYSDVVDLAVKGLEGTTPMIDKKKKVSLTPAQLEAVDLAELRSAHFLRAIKESPEPSYDISRERSLSAPLLKSDSSSSLELEVVMERDDKILKSVLRKDNCSDSYEKKTVQFCLPDIFPHPNTSR